MKMKSDEDLSKELEIVLSKYPNLRELVLDPFQRLSRKEGWLKDNVLAQSILIDRGDLVLHEEALAHITSINTKAIGSLRRKLKGKKARQIEDFWTEVRTFQWLEENSFTDIEVVGIKSPEFPGKIPDYKAVKKGVPYIVEVANLRAPSEIVEKLFNKLYELYLRFPDKFGRQFEIDAQGIYGRGDMPEETIDKRIAIIIEKINLAKIDQEFVEHSWEDDGDTKTIIVRMTPGKFELMGGGDTQSDDLQWRADVALGIIRRFLDKVNQKAIQLRDADPNYQREHLIVVRVGIEGYASIFLENGLSRLFDAISAQYAKVLGERIVVAWFR